MIDIDNLNKRFGKLKVLNNINLHLAKGECIALIGPNGCGKTTLIKTILGMVIPDSGDIRFQGKSIKDNYLYRQDIGYMPQIGRYPENMTVGQLVRMISDLRQAGSKTDAELQEAFNLPDLFHKRMGTLSGGTTQKVSAVLAFLFNPQVLILDEPTAGLDPLASEILKEKIVREKEKGKLILITSHLLSELDELVTRIIFMEEGNVVFHKPVDELKRDTGEDRISKAITHILKKQVYEPNY
jgi:Cu-processing system ATP-binding protein